MTIKSMFFNAVQNGNTYDRVYSAEDFSGYLDKIVGDGVFASPSVNLQVIANNPANMAVYVHAGQGWIKGHKLITTEPIGIIVPAAHGTSARVDSVNFYLDYEEREMGVRIVTGTPGSSEPPSLRQTSTFWEYRLARLDVGAGATSISQANITDRRGTPECPFVAGLIDEIDAESLFAQWDDQFNDWLVGVQEQLSRMGSFVSGIRRLEAVYTTSSASTVSSFDVTTYISEYSPVTDCLELFINGLKLTTDEYTLNGTTVTLSEAIVQKRVPIDIVVWHVYAPGDDYIQEIRLPGYRVPVVAHTAYIPVDNTLTQERIPGEAKKTGDELAKKVDKVEGKGLSTNDFTDADKTKLDGIEDGAEVNVIEEIKLGGVALTPGGNRVVDIPVDDTLEEANTPADSKAVGDSIEDLDERKANIDGYYETLTSGQTEQIIATEAIMDTEPYIYRKTSGANDVGDRAFDTIVGGSVVWNQLLYNGDFAHGNNNWQARVGTLTVSDGIATVVPTATGTDVGLTRSSAIPVTIGHVFFQKADIKPTFNGTIRISANGGVHRSEVQMTQNVWNTCCGIYKIESDVSRTCFYVKESIDTSQSIQYKNAMYIDLTAAVTPLIADYIYTLETANAGDGVAWFKKYFPGVYYGYCEPHFEHVQTSAKETVGFNQWDEEWVGGTYNQQGVIAPTNRYMCSKNLIPVLPNTTYYFKTPDKYFEVLSYDADRNYLRRIRSSVKNGTVTMDDKTHYIAFGSAAADAYTAYTPGDICINISDPARNGEYKPYKKRTYPLEALTLRGIPKLDSANRLYFEGDVYRHDGSGETRYSEYTFTGNETWTFFDAAGKNTFNCVISGAKSGGNGMMAGKYALSSVSVISLQDDKTFIFFTGSGETRISVYDSAYSDANAFAASMAGVKLVYEKSTPEPFTAEPFQYPMVVDPLGTERFIDYAFEQGERDVEIPVGHTSDYPPNLRDKLQNLPSLSSDGDGRYIIVQTGNQMVLSPDTSAGLIAALEARVAALEGGS